MDTGTKRGLVAFFDILGYSAFIENNKAEVAAQKINGFINEIEKLNMSDHLKSFLGKGRIADVSEKISYLIISDSILVTLECDLDDKGSYRLYATVFLIYCSFLSKRLFIFGLPLRGCIEYGEYYIKDHTFAGMPIIKAYQNSEKIDLAACEISESIFSTNLTIDNISKLGIGYKIPTKNEDKHSVLLNFLLKLDENDKNIIGKIPDFKQFIIDSFAAHNKYIGSNVYRKINNTEMFLRYCKAVIPEKSV